jgi:hypothetical protein
MKVPTGLLVLIAILGVIYAASGVFKDYIISNSTGKGPPCLELLGKSTRDDEGRTYIIGSIRKNCTRKFSSVTVVFKLDRVPGPTESLPEGIAYAYVRDIAPGETRQYKSALPVSRDATFRLDTINAY